MLLRRDVELSLNQMDLGLEVRRSIVQMHSAIQIGRPLDQMFLELEVIIFLSQIQITV
jgi:hypothetical protein